MVSEWNSKEEIFLSHASRVWIAKTSENLVRFLVRTRPDSQMVASCCMTFGRAGVCRERQTQSENDSYFHFFYYYFYFFGARDWPQGLIRSGQALCANHQNSTLESSPNGGHFRRGRSVHTGIEHWRSSSYPSEGIKQKQSQEWERELTGVVEAERCFMAISLCLFTRLRGMVRKVHRPHVHGFIRFHKLTTWPRST